ncbi:hypothetical protein H1W83_28595 (plasmid) [Priestia megaterium]|uniref:hypothetical protein n=1 Tax=Priestia megaterium TaxID=1404 RepID=UPI001EDC6B03|nr:hypothetical protein [Priestia megaterium]UKJ83557.1 hypothetical protein H1W83_28595 [Priestia megaterium]
MVKLLDAGTSQNASFANSISIPLSTTPQLFFRHILSTAGAIGTVRSQITGTVTVQLPLVPVASTITVIIVRGTTPSDPIIYSVSEVLDLAIVGPQVLSFTASDFNFPLQENNRVTYTGFITTSLVGATRVGPESVNATIYSD